MQTMRRCLFLLAVWTVCLGLSSSASAGTLSSEAWGCDGGSCPIRSNVTYRAAPNEANRVRAQNMPGGGLLLRDSGARIRDVTKECVLRSPHTAFCPRPSGSLVIEGGNRGDIIDARGFTGSWFFISGGSGNDKLYAPNFGGQLRGGEGHNLLVGNRYTSVVYREAEGPVSVDLAKGVGIAPGEHDRIVGVGEVEGSKAYSNRLTSSWAPGGSIKGGEGTNYLVAHMGAWVSMAAEHKASTVVCAKGARVEDLRASDLALGQCTVEAVSLTLPLRSLNSPVFTIPKAAALGLNDVEPVRVTVRALPSNAVIAQVNVSPSGSPMLHGRLSTAGKALLRRVGRMRVHVEGIADNDEFAAPPSMEIVRRPPFMNVDFSTILTLPGHRRG